jgi:hypothetical protein
MKTLIVGGNFGDESKASSVVTKIGYEFEEVETINGGTLESLPHEMNMDLIIWMPNITNETPKQYPKKSNGNVLICSKVMREGYLRAEAVSRIFKMRGNAVIAIYPGEKFVFELIDALGNTWYTGSEISELCNSIKEFYAFTNEAWRINSERQDIEGIERNNDLVEFIEVNKSLTEFIQTSCGTRFFGNISTRCQKLFPAMKVEYDYVFVSPRNSNKESLTPEDMILAWFDVPDQQLGKIFYSGVNKPSVDTPIQVMLYNMHQDVNYMIHGHAFIKDCPTTNEYYVCGDMREVDEVDGFMCDKAYGKINLKKHGFLIFADTLDNLKQVIKTCEFDYQRE